MLSLRSLRYWVLASSLALLPGCVGRIFSSSSSESTSPAPGTFDPSFKCSGSPTLAPTTIRRQAKVHLVNSIQEFLSTLSSADVATVMGGIQTQLNLIPEDAANPYSRNDTSVTQSHAGGLFELGFALGSLLSASDTYVGELASVCGAGSTRASLTGTCAQTFVTHYALKAFRRPPTSAEVADLMTDPASTATPPANLDLTSADGMTSLLTRLFSHPRFFYRMDNEGTLVTGTDGTSGATYQLSPYELLSKLTFLYWDAPPTDALYAQVATADLSKPDQVDALVWQLASDPKAQNGVENFYAEWLAIRAIPQLDSMNSAAYKTFAAGENINVAGHNHRDDMIQEVVDLTSWYTFSTPGRYDDLMNSPYSFARTQDLAKLYGLTEVWDGTSKMVPFPSTQPRTGLLTRAAFLITGVEYTDPIIKGKKVRFNELCGVLPPPPPTVNVVPVRQDTVHTTRWLTEQATAGTPSLPMECLQCHQMMNPLGFLTEDYDSLGRYRTQELKFDSTTGNLVNQVPVDTLATPKLFTGDTQSYADGAALNAGIAQEGVGQQCMVRQFFRYAFARQEDTVQDGCSLEDMRQHLVNTDGTGINGANGSLLQLFASTALQPQFLQRQVQ